MKIFLSLSLEITTYYFLEYMELILGTDDNTNTKCELILIELFKSYYLQTEIISSSLSLNICLGDFIVKSRYFLSMLHDMDQVTTSYFIRDIITVTPTYKKIKKDPKNTEQLLMNPLILFISGLYDPGIVWGWPPGLQNPESTLGPVKQGGEGRL